MKKFTFMIDGYEDHEPSDYEYMYDEDRLWELSYDVIASSKEEAMKKLLDDSYAYQRDVIDEDRVKILRIFGDPESQFTENSNYTYLIVSTKDVRPGVDFVEENITIIEKSFTKNKWCSDGIEKISTYLFSDGFSIKEINRGAPGWSESETLLIDNSNNNCFTLYTRGEDTYNSGDKKIYACQSLRFKAISKYEDEKALLKRKFKASLLNAMETSRQTFLDREMPYLVA